jgi:hypothetical protein
MSHVLFALYKMSPIPFLQVLVWAVPGVPEDRQPKDVQRLQAGRVLWQGGAEDGLARAQDGLQGGWRHHEASRDQACHREGKKSREEMNFVNLSR